MSLFGSFANWLYGGDQIAADSASVDSKIQALNAQKVASGELTQQQADAANADLSLGDSRILAPGSTNPDDAISPYDISGAADQGLKDAAQAELDLATKTVSGVTGGVGAVLWAIIKGIPWWVWLGLVAWVAWELGLLKRLKGSFDK